MSKIYLDKIQNIFTTPRDLGVSDLESLMVNIRLVLEIEKLKEKYNILNLYCNWCMHAKIQDSITVYRILEYITQAIISYEQNPDDSEWIHDAVINGLKFHELQLEIIDFIKRFSLDIEMFSNDDFWKGIGRSLIDNLIERQITLNLKTKNQKFLSIYERIVKIANDSNKPSFAVMSLEFIYMNNQQFLGS
ncbi:hypothetical protein [Pedobacter sp. N23S346]|uniref:hypothetical protein n=1 Tax=Pedobacter sp. N23S346 TaxID=3402750 RepID=UPI003AD6DC81